MIKTEMVYCVECESIKSKSNADKVFKTGYYKTIIPLCHCKDCANTVTNKLNVDLSGDSEQCYSGYEASMYLFASP
jgi:hypothetical protein